MGMRKFEFRRLLGQATLCALCSGMLTPAIAQQTFQRTYKATAYVTLFSIPIFSRSDVGYGLATEEEQKNGDGKTVGLQFLGGSIPERAHGLNRFGYIQESVEQDLNSPMHARYAGLMTASKEESLNDAKAALNATNTGKMPCVAAAGEISNRELHSTVWNVMVPTPKEPAVDDVMQIVKTSLEAAPALSPKTQKSLPAVGAGTFLYSLREAILSPESSSKRKFLYNAKAYLLHTDKRRDVGVEAEMHRANLTVSDAPLVRLTGVIENQATHDRTEFNVWYQEGSVTILPLRFAFRPKSYLRLVFDAQPAPKTPVAGELSLVRGVSLNP